MSSSSIKKKDDDFIPRPNLAVKRSAEQDDSISINNKAIGKMKLGFNSKKSKDDFAESMKSKKVNESMKSKKVISNISLQLKSMVSSPNTTSTAVKPKVGKVAAAFDSDEDEEEEMPPEAKMRMKNIGRNTPTSSGPNSFGKGKMGFCDTSKVYERKLKELENKVSND